MLTKVELRTPQGSILNLPVGSVEAGFALLGLDGLEPVNATLVFSEYANYDGALYHSARRGPRDLKLKIGLEPTGSVTVSGLRQTVYQFLMPKTAISIRLYLDSGMILNIDGRNEVCDTTIFSRESVVEAIIRCPNPDFVNATATTFSGNTVETTSESTLTYPGSVEAGYVFALAVNRSIDQVVLHHLPPDGIYRIIEFYGDLVSGDVLTISTIPGDKKAILTRSGVDSSVLYGVTPQSNWSALAFGTNTFRAYVVGAAIPYTITYSSRYGGL